MAKIRVFGKKIPNKKGAYYLRINDKKTYHVVPNKEMFIEESEYKQFKKYFRLPTPNDEVKTIVRHVEETKTENVLNVSKNRKGRPSKKSQAIPKQSEFIEETIDLTEEIEKEEKPKAKSGLSEFLELKKKVAELGINTHGKKKAELISILMENGIF